MGKFMDNRRAVKAQSTANKQAVRMAKASNTAANNKAKADSKAASLAYKRSTSLRTLGAERKRANIDNRMANQQFKRDSKSSSQLHRQEQNAAFRANNQLKQRIKTERGNGLQVLKGVHGFTNGLANIGAAAYGAYKGQNPTPNTGVPDGYYLASDGNYYRKQAQAEWNEEDGGPQDDVYG